MMTDDADTQTQASSRKPARTRPKSPEPVWSSRVACCFRSEELAANVSGPQQIPAAGVAHGQRGRRFVLFPRPGVGQTLYEHHHGPGQRERRSDPEHAGPQTESRQLHQA